MNDLDFIRLAEECGSTHKRNLGVYQFYESELEHFTDRVKEETLEQVYQLLRKMDQEANGRHNYWLYAINEIKREVNK